MSQVINILSKDIRLPAAGVRTYKPTMEEEKYVRDGLSYLVIKAPFFAHLFYNETELRYSLEIPWAATDARSVFMNPKAMIAAKWTIKHCAFVLAHEIAHVFFNDLIMAIKYRRDGFVMTHLGELPYLHGLMNSAEDYRINAMLVDAGIGEMPPVGLYDPTISQKGMEPAIQLYCELFDARSGGRGGRGGQPGDPTTPDGGHGGFDIHLEPTEKAAKEDDNGRREQAIAAAAAAAQASGQGKIPAAIMKMIGDILEPKVPWQDHLRSTMMRHGGDPTYDWRYLDKRLMMRSEPMYFARQAHMGAGHIVIADDTSGSCCDPKVVQTFFSEMNGICAALNPQFVTVIWCDAAVHRVDELEDVEDLLDYKQAIEDDGGVGGGGGTDFRPVFRKIEEMGIQPDMLVFLTDTYGDFPEHEPDYPVVWASIVNDPGRVPWGEFVFIDMDD